MIEPTIGRVVWYWENSLTGDKKPLAAIIADVWSSSSINLMVINRDGTTQGIETVYLLPDGAPRPAGHFAEWMPYQKGQAAKTEALEAKAAL